MPAERPFTSLRMPGGGEGGGGGRPAANPIDAVGDCRAQFRMIPTQIDGGGAQAMGFVLCESRECPLYSIADVYGNADSGDSANPAGLAEGKVRMRARREIRDNCLEWAAVRPDPDTPVPNHRLPRSLRRI